MLPALILAVTTAKSVAVPMGWRPFMTPMPIWNYWFLTLLPLCAGVSLVYKTTKTADTGAILREAALLTIWIALGLIGAAGAIAVVVRFT